MPLLLNSNLRQTSTQELFPLNVEATKPAIEGSNIHGRTLRESSEGVSHLKDSPIPVHMDNDVLRWTVDDICRWLRINEMEEFTGEVDIFS